MRFVASGGGTLENILSHIIVQGTTKTVMMSYAFNNLYNDIQHVVRYPTMSDVWAAKSIKFC